MDSKIVIELDEQDMNHLATIFKSARMAMGDLDGGTILKACHELLDTAEAANPPRFVMARLARLVSLVEMVEDQDWALPKEDTSRVLNALAYFANPDDLIPDDVPGLGLLDDAVMVELVCRELKHEIAAYESFCNFREIEKRKRASKGDDKPVTRQDWLENERKRVSKERSKSKSWLPWNRKKDSFLDA